MFTVKNWLETTWRKIVRSNRNTSSLLLSLQALFPRMVKSRTSNVVPNYFKLLVHPNRYYHCHTSALNGKGSLTDRVTRCNRITDMKCAQGKWNAVLDNERTIASLYGRSFLSHPDSTETDSAMTTVHSSIPHPSMSPLIIFAGFSHMKLEELRHLFYPKSLYIFSF